MLRKRGLTTRFFFTVCNHQRAVLSIYRSNNDTAKRTVAMRCSRSYTIDVLRPCRMFITLASHGDNDNFLFSCLLQLGAERASSYSLFSFFLFFLFFSFFFVDDGLTGMQELVQWLEESGGFLLFRTLGRGRIATTVK